MSKPSYLPLLRPAEWKVPAPFGLLSSIKRKIDSKYGFEFLLFHLETETVTCFFLKFPVTENFFTKLLPAESTSLSWNLLEGGPPTISSKCQAISKEDLKEHKDGNPYKSANDKKLNGQWLSVWHMECVLHDILLKGLWNTFFRCGWVGVKSLNPNCYRVIRTYYRVSQKSFLVELLTAVLINNTIKP